MKLTEDFTTQANIGRAIAYAMTEHPEYYDILEERLPTMADKGQAESLRIKLRILLEMLNEE